MMDLKSTDYLIAIALAVYVIKQLIEIIKNKKEQTPSKNNDTNESEILYRQSMMAQHEKMIVALTGIVAVTKSTNDKCGNMEKDIIVIKERTEK